MTTQVGLFGHPVKQNLSAIMHNAAFDALSMPWRYLLRDVEPGNVGTAVRQALSEGWAGWNVTIPHKLEIVASMNRLSPDAAIIGAVNTVQVTPEGLVGHNTDGAGCMLAMRQEIGQGPEGLRVVQIGSGGAGRAVAVYLAKEGAREILLCDADQSRSQGVVALLVKHFPEVGVRALARERLPEALRNADMIVNATPIGMWPKVDTEPPIIRSGCPRAFWSTTSSTTHPVRSCFKRRSKEDAGFSADCPCW